MENLINKVIEALEMRLGEGYTIIPKDKRKNNGLILHGICIHRESDSVSPVIYVDEFIRHCGMEEQSPEEIVDYILETYRQDEVPQNVAAYVKDFGKMKELVRIKLINHAANISELGSIPHRRFLDLAVTYYLDMEPAIAGQNASATITNGLMEIWGITEDDLYGLGMERLAAGDDCYITDMLSILRRTTQKEEDEMTDWSGPEMYVATNKKGLFGANCIMHVPLLQKMAEDVGCSLIIFPSSIHELVIIPQKNGSENYMDTGDIQAINTAEVAREECLSNSIYRYDRERREISVFKEGTPLSW